MTINSIEIFDKGNTHSRITVTANNDVRIKIGKYISPEEKDQVVYTLTEAARMIIDNGYNTQTLRGTYKPTRDRILHVATEAKAPKRKTFKIDTQLIGMMNL